MIYRKLDYDKIIKFIVLNSYKIARLYFIFYFIFYEIVPFLFDIIILRIRDDYTVHNIKSIIFITFLLYITRVPKYQEK